MSKPSPLSITPLANYVDYIRYKSHNKPYGRYIRETEQAVAANQGESFTFDAYCYVCQQQVGYKVIRRSQIPNWRETLGCPGCKLNNRKRAVIHLFEQTCSPQQQSNIYLSEQASALFTVFRKRYPSITGSEYLGNAVPLGSKNAQGIRNEDLTRLTFKPEQFNTILSFDVLEHVPDYQAAITDCFRCLKPGGAMYFTVPFLIDEEKNRIRARIKPDGEIEHIMPPEYHGDPLNKTGVLCFYHFGWDLFDQMRSIGFKDVFALLYWSDSWGYLGGRQLLFKAVKH